MGNEVFISTSDNIPTKKVVALIGEVSAKKVMFMGENPEACFEELKNKAREMGANAVINVTYYPSGNRGTHGIAKGFAVRVEDAYSTQLPPPPPPPTNHAQLCPTCSHPMTFIKQYGRWYCYNCKKYP